MAKAIIIGVKKEIPTNKFFISITQPVTKGKNISTWISFDLIAKRNTLLKIVLN